MAHAEFEVKPAALLLVVVYDSYWLWCSSVKMIQNICCIDLVQVLGSQANAEELERFSRVIERTNFASLPSDWSRRVERSSLAPGWRRSGGDY